MKIAKKKNQESRRKLNKQKHDPKNEHKTRRFVFCMHFFELITAIVAHEK